MKLDADAVFIHDPQPVGLVQRKHELGNRWVWRCHVDVSKPDLEAWNFLLTRHLRDYLVLILALFQPSGTVPS